ncbi:XRE family transcriptional regulator [Roseococcus sp. SDR]|uniref:XRE family transcriptional regulator n=1 Tax=Roseococcus sp. SDR TaxID=2835532 RepID=UPI001BCBDF03|nr:XRE family transcriptional regulator [Roseococcus sp. SDR]MBS7792189.1 helix-turn-helix transcriptional regulator [Roseococcus sp. SDR]MBV1847503.1 XRE family transcriptional regulator [Roseococcus sp. SDR]
MSVLHHKQNPKGRGFAFDALAFFALSADLRPMGRPRTSPKAKAGRPFTRLTVLRDAARLNQEELAAKAECSASQVSRYESGAQPIFATKFLAIMRALGVTDPADILTEQTYARMCGTVGAGAVVFPLDDDGELLPAPPGMTDAVAVRVTGTSMMPAYRPGDVLFCEARPVDRKDILHEDCVVETMDGQRLVKKVLPGGAPDTVRLFSYETMDSGEDIQLRTAAVVRWVQRR